MTTSLDEQGLPVPPDTEFTQAALLRASAMPKFLFDHSVRSWQLAVLVSGDAASDLDSEVLYAGALLHDLGLWEPPADPGDRFEALGANTARALALEHGLDRHRAANLWDVVALHADSLADHKSPETAALAAGVSADVSGGALPRVPAAAHGPVFVTRAGFSPQFVGLLVEYARNYPSGAAFTWLQPVVERHLPGVTWPDLEARAAAHPFE